MMGWLVKAIKKYRRNRQLRRYKKYAMSSDFEYQRLVKYIWSADYLEKRNDINRKIEFHIENGTKYIDEIQRFTIEILEKGNVKDYESFLKARSEFINNLK